MIEVDVETGRLTFLRYAAVHDAGTIVNPRTLDGQVIGGTVQGLGTALYEEILYDDGGPGPQRELRPLPPAVVNGRPDDDGRPPGDAVALHRYGIKGAGEGGRMLTPAILSAAIEDALVEYGVTVTSLPISAEQIVDWASRTPGT